ncbi:MAG: hypothetical protein MK179_22970 [Pirellulaceae bacterium]|nr:hypothetical protein [Pirellulaceae bacterium]
MGCLFDVRIKRLLLVGPILLGAVCAGDVKAGLDNAGPDESRTVIIQSSPAAQNSGTEIGAEEDEGSELCKLVIEVTWSRGRCRGCDELKADIAAGIFDAFVIHDRPYVRERGYPYIRVPVGRRRYRVWSGYNARIRDAVLKAAGRQAQGLPGGAAQVSAKRDETGSAAPPKALAIEGGYPTRGSWWTVGGRHPEKEPMVRHLSGGPHKNKFSLDWLNSLDRAQLHALHSDDHENRVQWTYVTPFTDSPASDKVFGSDDSLTATQSVTSKTSISP